MLVRRKKEIGDGTGAGLHREVCTLPRALVSVLSFRSTRVGENRWSFEYNRECFRGIKSGQRMNTGRRR
jgi:hypothetical protein